MIIFLKPYLFPFLRLYNHQTTPARAINSTIGTTTAIAIIAPSPSLLDTSPCGLERADEVDDVVMVSIILTFDVVGGVGLLASELTSEVVGDVGALEFRLMPDVAGDVALLVFDPKA